MYKIVYDIDDTLWGLNQRIAKKLNLPYESITDVDYIRAGFSEEGATRIFRLFEEAETFTDIDFYPGIERLLDIEQYGAEIYINSCACSDDVIKQKRQELLRVLPNLNPERLNIYSIAGQTKHSKTIGPDTLIFIDDGPHNIARSQAKYNIMPRQPWNTSESAKRFRGRATGEVIMVDDLNAIIDKVEELIRQESTFQ